MYELDHAHLASNTAPYMGTLPRREVVRSRTRVGTIQCPCWGHHPETGDIGFPTLSKITIWVGRSCFEHSTRDELIPNAISKNSFPGLA